ncbi:MAG: hypothetical protein JKY37_23305 [Nannocystaceae bacterium]|nr:hypothetical protein [Nannocystaceae bacterium]
MNTEQPTSGAHPVASSEHPALAEVAANGGPPTAVARTPAIVADVGEIVFEILVAVMWSDGELASVEVECGRAAADVMQIRPKRGGSLGAMADGPLPFPAIAFDRVDASGRRLAYAAACWLDDASEETSDRRTSFLAAVRTKLDLNDETVARMRDLASAVRAEFEDARDAFAALMQRVYSPL